MEGTVKKRGVRESKCLEYWSDGKRGRKRFLGFKGSRGQDIKKTNKHSLKHNGCWWYNLFAFFNFNFQNLSAFTLDT